MAFYSYKMTRDYGFAPNPFGGVCTLATCKPHIRKKAEVGDWIIGTGSKEMHMHNRLIYLMQVTEKLKMEDYWHDPRYQFKKPILNGSLVTIHGDNVYSKDNTGAWVQAACQHSHANLSSNIEHLENDTSGEYVLISNFFYYFGNQNVKVPNEYLGICSTLRDYSSPKVLDADLCGRFVAWIAKKYSVGIYGSPIHWQVYAQMTLF